ncbi:MAG: hypothetical protein SFY80_16025 [Verrucomicrobiota bacterium]|nr:hypothetical protein [Verrucomicrobiota bacterium]
MFSVYQVTTNTFRAEGATTLEPRAPPWVWIVLLLIKPCKGDTHLSSAGVTALTGLIDKRINRTQGDALGSRVDAPSVRQNAMDSTLNRYSPWERGPLARSALPYLPHRATSDTKPPPSIRSIIRKLPYK